jgi:hypothetical protein
MFGKRLLRISGPKEKEVPMRAEKLHHMYSFMRYYQGDQIKEDEMTGEFKKNGRG